MTRVDFINLLQSWSSSGQVALQAAAQVVSNIPGLNLTPWQHLQFGLAAVVVAMAFNTASQWAHNAALATPVPGQEMPPEHHNPGGKGE